MTTTPPSTPRRADKTFWARLSARWHTPRGPKPAALSKPAFDTPPAPSQDRLDASLADVPLDTDALVQAPESSPEKNKTILYLAYGSNLSDESFRRKRGIRPLSQVNVLVPELRLTFDLPGIAYMEPCFANTARRDPNTSHSSSSSSSSSSSGSGSGSGSNSSERHKDRWHKGLVGTVYEVTLKDYAHIIATEGGGAAYHDILIDCHVLLPGAEVPRTPTSAPFKAHTLFAPAATRPDASYAQPSARYLKLITDGAAERALPAEYQAYLAQIRVYTITSVRQAVGRVVFLGTWMPVVVLMFAVSKMLQDKKGRVPKWYGRTSNGLFALMWVSYDVLFKRVFGEGERTVGDGAVARRGSAETERLLGGVVEEVRERAEESGRKKRWCDPV